MKTELSYDEIVALLRERLARAKTEYSDYFQLAERVGHLTITTRSASEDDLHDLAKTFSDLMARGINKQVFLTVLQHPDIAIAFASDKQLQVLGVQHVGGAYLPVQKCLLINTHGARNEILLSHESKHAFDHIALEAAGFHFKKHSKLIAPFHPNSKENIQAYNDAFEQGRKRLADFKALWDKKQAGQALSKKQARRFALYVEASEGCASQTGGVAISASDYEILRQRLEYGEEVTVPLNIINETVRVVSVSFEPVSRQYVVKLEGRTAAARFLMTIDTLLSQLEQSNYKAHSETWYQAEFITHATSHLTEKAFKLFFPKLHELQQNYRQACFAISPFKVLYGAIQQHDEPPSKHANSEALATESSPRSKLDTELSSKQVKALVEERVKFQGNALFNTVEPTKDQKLRLSKILYFLIYHDINRQAVTYMLQDREFNIVFLDRNELVRLTSFAAVGGAYVADHKTLYLSTDGLKRPHLVSHEFKHAFDHAALRQPDCFVWEPNSFPGFPIDADVMESYEQAIEEGKASIYDFETLLMDQVEGRVLSDEEKFRLQRYLDACQSKYIKPKTNVPVPNELHEELIASGWKPGDVKYISLKGIKAPSILKRLYQDPITGETVADVDSGVPVIEFIRVMISTFQTMEMPPYGSMNREDRIKEHIASSTTFMSQTMLDVFYPSLSRLQREHRERCFSDEKMIAIPVDEVSHNDYGMVGNVDPGALKVQTDPLESLANQAGLLLGYLGLKTVSNALPYLLADGTDKTAEQAPIEFQAEGITSDVYTQHPIFHVKAVRSDAEVGRAKFYGQPTWCMQNNGVSNMQDAEGVFAEGPQDAVMKPLEACSLNPLTITQKMWHQSQAGLRSGSLFGAAAGIAAVTVSQAWQPCITEVLGWTFEGLVSYLQLQDFTQAGYLTLEAAAISLSIKGVCWGFEQSGTGLKTLGQKYKATSYGNIFEYAGTACQWTAKIGRYSPYFVGLYQYGCAATLAKVATAIATQHMVATATEKSIHYVAGSLTRSASSLFHHTAKYVMPVAEGLMNMERLTR